MAEAPSQLQKTLTSPFATVSQPAEAAVAPPPHIEATKVHANSRDCSFQQAPQVQPCGPLAPGQLLQRGWHALEFSCRGNLGAVEGLGLLTGGRT